MYSRICISQFYSFLSFALANPRSIVYRSERLPHDAFSLVPLPLPVGGALVVCANMVLHVNQGFSCGLALNDFGDKQVCVRMCLCAGPR